MYSHRKAIYFVCLFCSIHIFYTGTVQVYEMSVQKEGNMRDKLSKLLGRETHCVLFLFISTGKLIQE